MANSHALARANELFNEVDDFTKDDLISALDWARDTLTDHEGSGHQFALTAHDNQFVCSFAKPQWGGDHSTEARSTAPDAIVWAVCTYLAGM